MSYKLLITRNAQKEMANLDNQYIKQIKSDINLLSEEPRPFGYSKLKGRDGYRIKSGDYRVIYEIDDDKLEITILHVGHRKDVYK